MPVLDVHGDVVAGAELPAQNAFGNRGFQLPLDRPFERAGAIDRVVADSGEPIEGVGIHLEAQLLVLKPLGKPLDLKFDDLPQFLLFEAVEDDRLIQTVEELRAEVAA